MPDPVTRPLKVFLCHASADKPAVRRLFRYLRSKGLDPWLDEFKLLPGQRWQEEIPKALYASDAIIVVLSNNSVTKEGYVQREIKFALDKALEMPQGRIFLIPARLEECEIPDSLKGYQWVDLFQRNWNRRLMTSLNERAADLGITPLSNPVVEILPSVNTIQPTHSANSEKTYLVEANDSTSQFAHPIEAPKLVSQPVEATLDGQDKEIDAKTQSSELTNKRLIAVRVIFGLLVLAFVIWGGSKIFANPPVGPQATRTPSPTKTSDSSSTATLTSELASTSTLSVPTPSTVPARISDKDGMTLLYVDFGTFKMGSNSRSDDEKPMHTIELSSFWIDKSEVTNVMYAKCVQSMKCNPPSSAKSYKRDSYYGNHEYDNYPVIYVSWHDAKSYCEWAGRRLPTEAEWEKAARGDDAREYPWGNEISNNKLLNAFFYESEGSNLGDTASVGMYPDGQSPYGALDMAGNVFEWVEDWYGKTHYALRTSKTDPSGPSAGTLRVIRGGSWGHGGPVARTSFRGKLSPDSSNYYVGFRCAMSASPYNL